MAVSAIVAKKHMVLTCPRDNFTHPKLPFYSIGTEIGGSFLSSSLIHENVPSMFSTPVLGSQFLLQNDGGESIESSSFVTDRDGSDSGELVLVPPALGMSTTLLNRDHYTEYYEGMSNGPSGEVLRRHGDEVEYVRSSLHLSEEDRNSTTPYFRALGRSDDTMNIGGKCQKCPHNIVVTTVRFLTLVSNYFDR